MVAGIDETPDAPAARTNRDATGGGVDDEELALTAEFADREWRRLFSELFCTFLLTLAAAVGAEGSSSCSATGKSTVRPESSPSR